MSAIVPPTIVEPVEPAAPAMKRKTVTVWMFLALWHMMSAAGPAIIITTHKAVPTCIMIKINVETVYIDWRPNSSDKGARTKGKSAKPSGYTARATVA